MLTTIPPPSLDTPYAGRHLDCRNALQEVFTATLQQARRAGWVEGEIAVSLRELANEHLEWILTEPCSEAAISARAALDGFRTG